MSIVFLKTPFHKLSIGYTTKSHGFSIGDYSNFNLAEHVGDEYKCVIKNRAHFLSYFPKKSSVKWLEQQHTNVAISFEDYIAQPCDAIYTSTKNRICAVMTADCLPIILFDKGMTKVAAIHAGWKGLANGVLESTLKQFVGLDIVVWFGPCITQPYFEVGQDVYDKFTKNNETNKTAFIEKQNNKYLFDMKKVATNILNKNRCIDIVDSKLCTYSDDRFYSYRKSGKTGRIASFIVLGD
jgi:hypothetical protein